jgi:hypothetical protein
VVELARGSRASAASISLGLDDRIGGA